MEEECCSGQRGALERRRRERVHLQVLAILVFDVAAAGGTHVVVILMRVGALGKVLLNSGVSIGALAVGLLCPRCDGYLGYWRASLFVSGEAHENKLAASSLAQVAWHFGVV